MELARAERALNRPKNWGEITYKNIKKREEDRENGLLPILPPSIKVRAVLETQPIVTGTLDGSEAITELLEDEQCDFFSRYSQCRGFVLRNWSFVAHKVLRCISISFAESLVELDLSDSAVNSTHLEVLLVRTTALKILKLNNCPLINTAAILILVKLLSPTLIELYLSRCAQVSTDPLLWIGGVAGFKTNSLSKLKLLDLSEDPIEDRGLIAIAEGCKRIVFLNLFNCDRVTDVSIIAIAQSCKHLTIVNLAGCQLLTSKAIVAIGKNCHELISINISRCTLVSDKAVQALAKGCSHLQACNLAGLLKLSEEAIFYLADHCKGLLMLNLTGCEKITVNGLNALISGLPCVEKGITFMGFKPIDQHIEHKLAGHLLTMERSAIKLIREGQVKKKKKKEEQEFIISNRLNHAATLIQQYIKRYTMRLRFYRIWQKKLGTRCAIFIQRIQRGINGRKYAKFLKQKRETFLALSPYALLIQKNVRGYLCRIFNPQVSRSIREMYLLRRQEIEAAIAVRLQSHMRKYLGKKKVEIYKELRLRRDQNVYDAILSMQLLARRYISKIILLRKKLAKQSYDEAKRIAGMKIKLFCVDGMRRYKSRLTGSALRKFYREKWTGSELIQKVYRGFKGRESAHQLKIQLAVKHYAATLIQRVFRGSRILYWRDMRLNVVAAYVLDRQYLERRVSIEASRLRYQQFLKENRCDSASEPDDEDEEQEYIKTYDAAKKMYYWQNYVSGEIFYDEPLDPLAHEKSLIGRRVKVYWIVQGAWYEGSITNYHKRKKRHRVDYDDGDHEWVNLLNECDRVQVQLDDGSWAMVIAFIYLDGIILFIFYVCHLYLVLNVSIGRHVRRATKERREEEAG